MSASAILYGDVMSLEVTWRGSNAPLAELGGPFRKPTTSQQQDDRPVCFQ